MVTVVPVEYSIACAKCAPIDIKESSARIVPFCGVVAVDAFGGEYVPADPLGERAQHGRTGADMIGQSRDVEVNAFAGLGFALPVQRLMLAELGIEDHRQQARPDMAARDDVERCR